MNAGRPDDDALRFRGFDADGTPQYVGPDGWPRTPEEHAEILEDEAIERARDVLDRQGDGNE
ncbi:hypothetical protein [Nocardia abscessus]|uniref:hypothetical protein n=1 Tax=Nocardia abscessus TaxID=120957 RepID=UPI002458C506|nr:hypothetical protein [Nocardia abscessus]